MGVLKGIDLCLLSFYVISLFPQCMVLNVLHLVNVMLLIYGNRSFDESTWGAFDNNDDVDSVWGFNTVKVTRVLISFQFY